jgi:hypothetical protein
MKVAKLSPSVSRAGSRRKVMTNQLCWKTWLCLMRASS